MSPGYILATPGRFVRSMTTIGRRYPFIEVKNPAGAFTIALPAAHTETHSISSRSSVIVILPRLLPGLPVGMVAQSPLHGPRKRPW
jgi:hypothetical protein